MQAGTGAALDAIERATGVSEINLIGYCLGGTLTGATLAYLKARGDERVISGTFFTSLLDFSEPGDIGVFVDEQQVSSLESKMNEQGFLDGAEMSSAFNMIRANDLIWSFVINNYLMGRKPAAFDLLFWNADSTRMPAKMHSTYLRKMYIENRFREPGGIEVNGVPIDLSSIDLPLCFVSALEDHIAPWKSTYAGAQLPCGDVQFILSKAGHIAGIVNPPGDKAYDHFIGGRPRDSDATEWLDAAQPKSGSWWATWADWVAPFRGEQVAARHPGDGGLSVIEAAPGSYATKRIS
ncbi:MAG: alpha/beta fold hydrolase, partial [Pseudomonadota bacterium]